jgi:hypothetical protein
MVGIDSSKMESSTSDLVLGGRCDSLLLLLNLFGFLD